MVGTAKYFLPGLLAQFRREHEGVEIRLVEGNRQQLVKLLQANEVDVAVMGRPPKELATRTGAVSPAAEAFRYFVLERGEAYLAQNFAAHLALAVS